jgi:hypothetical protein
MGPQGPKGPTGATGPTGLRGKNIHIANVPVGTTSSFPQSNLANAVDIRINDAVLGTNGVVATVNDRNGDNLMLSSTRVNLTGPTGSQGDIGYYIKATVDR